jgi:hypothetical protein
LSHHNSVVHRRRRVGTDATVVVTGRSLTFSRSWRKPSPSRAEAVDGWLKSRPQGPPCYGDSREGFVNDRMFHVLVLGGLALVCCGGSTAAGGDKGTSGT